MKKISFIMISMALILPAANMAQDSSFSSVEERNFILQTAGLDGQIAQDEWKADRPHFQNLTWTSLQSFDRDQDGLIGVNEFLRNMKRTFKMPEGPVGISVRPATTGKATLETVNITLPDPGLEKQTFNRRMLYQRAHIAKRTKFMKPLNPDGDFLKEKNRADQLKAITDKRRYAADRQPSMSTDDSRKLRDLYKSRLVKNRFSATSPTESGKRSQLKSQRRPSGTDEGPSWRRSLLEDRMNRSGSKDRSGDTGGTTPPPSSSERKKVQKPRTREASNIRNLIPRDQSKNGKSVPRKEIKEIDRKR